MANLIDGGAASLGKEANACQKVVGSIPGADTRPSISFRKVCQSTLVQSTCFGIFKKRANCLVWSQFYHALNGAT